jgi:hypothetical protein
MHRQSPGRDRTFPRPPLRLRGPKVAGGKGGRCDGGVNVRGVRLDAGGGGADIDAGMAARFVVAYARPRMEVEDDLTKGRRG